MVTKRPVIRKKSGLGRAHASERDSQMGSTSRSSSRSGRVSAASQLSSRTDRAGTASQSFSRSARTGSTSRQESHAGKGGRFERSERSEQQAGGRRGRGRPERGARDVRGRVPFSRDVEKVEEEEFIAGRRAVLEALKGERTLNKILLQEGISGGSLIEILALARDQSIIVQQAPKAKLDEVAKNRSHQGILAYVSAKPYVELEDLIEIAKKRRPGLLVLLDCLEDPHNLGSVLRSVDGAGASGVIIPKRRAAPLTGTVSKASAGALEHVDVARVTNVSQALEKLQSAGFWIVGATADAPQNYTQVDYTMPTVLVVGNEGTGLGRLTAERCDILVKLPMLGKVNSLNAGVATGILLYEVIRQRAKGKENSPQA